MRTLPSLAIVLADDAVTALTTAAPGALVTAADGESRTISGVVAPYDVFGATSVGPVKIKAGAIRLPDDLKRVKLNLDHDRNRTTGYMTAADDDDQALRGRFAIARTPLGDDALLEASEGVRDALSVELVDVTMEGHYITDALLVAVGQVPIPAYADARVENVAANHHTGGNMEPCQHCGRIHAVDTIEARACAAVVQASQGGAQPPAQPSAPVGQPAVFQASPPAGLPAVANHSPSDDGLPGLYAAMAAYYRGDRSPEVTAAIANITRTANEAVNDDSYEGQLWSGVQYQRRFVPLLSSGNLTAYKGTGWRWVVKPAVDDYAGDKAEVPSNAPTTEAANWTAARLAGAHDIDRKFYDFGDQEFISAYFEAMRESYARQSDLKAEAFIRASAADVGDAPDILRAAAIAADAVEDATDQPATFFLVNRTTRRTLLDVTDADVPTFLAMFGVRPEAFIASPNMPLNQVIAGTKAAGEFKELPGSPIRVEAVHVTHGGVDGGVFGYYATLLHSAGGFARCDIGIDQP